MSYFPDLKMAEVLRSEVQAARDAKRQERIDGAVRHVKISMQNAITARKTDCTATINGNAWETGEDARTELTAIADELRSKGYKVQLHINFVPGKSGNGLHCGHGPQHRLEISWS